MKYFMILWQQHFALHNQLFGIEYLLAIIIGILIFRFVIDYSPFWWDWMVRGAKWFWKQARTPY